MSEPSWRKPAGVFAILALIALWAVLVVSLSAWSALAGARAGACSISSPESHGSLPLKPLLRVDGDRSVQALKPSVRRWFIEATLY